MKHLKTILVSLLVLTASITNAQKITKGNLNFLKRGESVYIHFDYSKMSVGEYSTEANYIKSRVRDYNEKQPGKGDKWASQWNQAKKNKYQPKFVQLLEKYSKKSKLKFVKKKDNAIYGMKIVTNFLEPGFHIGVVRRLAEINVTVVFYEISNPDKILCKIEIPKSYGNNMGFNDYDSSERISAAYAKAGKTLGKVLKKKVKKK